MNATITDLKEYILENHHAYCEDKKWGNRQWTFKTDVSIISFVENIEEICDPFLKKNKPHLKFEEISGKTKGKVLCPISNFDNPDYIDSVISELNHLDFQNSLSLFKNILKAIDAKYLNIELSKKEKVKNKSSKI